MVMKEIIKIFPVVIFCVLLSACSLFENRDTDYFGFEPADFAIVKQEDTYGFFGDGTHYLILDCSQNADQAQEIVKDWKTFPLAENLQLVMYGGEKDNTSYVYNYARQAHWPTIRDGVYKFVDRHREATDPADDTNLLSRSSMSFSIAVYDLDTDTLYYFETNS